MKLSTKTFKVILESEDGSGEFIFLEPKANEIFLKTNSEKRIVDDLLEVRGVVNENGESVTVEQVKAYVLPVSDMGAIFDAYQEALKELIVGKKKAKKESD